MADAITITKSQIISDLESGLSRKQMREKYNMSINQVNTMIDAFGLKGAKKKGRRNNGRIFSFVNDIDPVTAQDRYEESLEPRLAIVSGPMNPMVLEPVSMGDYAQELDEF